MRSRGFKYGVLRAVIFMLLAVLVAVMVLLNVKDDQGDAGVTAMVTQTQSSHPSEGVSSPDSSPSESVPFIEPSDAPVVPEVVGVDSSDPEAVALEAGRIMTSWAPAEEDSMMVAVRRASALFTQDLKDHVDYSIRNLNQGHWLQMADLGAVSESKVRIHEELHDHGAGDVHDSEFFTVAATWSWKAEGFEQEHEDTRLFYFTLVLEDGQWKIDEYLFDDIPTRWLNP